MDSRKPIIIVAAALAGCAGPHFQEISAQGGTHSSVIVESRIAPAEEVKTTCYWKARESGIKAMEAPPGCVFQENGHAVILWADPGSFNNQAGLEVGGHELYHLHNFKDHR